MGISKQIVELNSQAALEVNRSRDFNAKAANFILRNTLQVTSSLTAAQFSELDSQTTDAVLDLVTISNELAPIDYSSEQRESESDAEYSFRMHVKDPIERLMRSCNTDKFSGEDPQRVSKYKRATMLGASVFAFIAHDQADNFKLDSKQDYFWKNAKEANQVVARHTEASLDKKNRRNKR